MNPLALRAPDQSINSPWSTTFYPLSEPTLPAMAVINIQCQFPEEARKIGLMMQLKFALMPNEPYTTPTRIPTTPILRS